MIEACFNLGWLALGQWGCVLTQWGMLGAVADTNRQAGAEKELCVGISKVGAAWDDSAFDGTSVVMRNVVCFVHV